MLKFFKQKYKWLAELLPFFYKSFKKSKELRLRHDNRSAINDNDILLFATIKNEGHRLEFFLEYYRKLGINHFIIVDNASTDNTAEFLSQHAGGLNDQVQHLTYQVRYCHDSLLSPSIC